MYEMPLIQPLPLPSSDAVRLAIGRLSRELRVARKLLNLAKQNELNQKLASPQIITPTVTAGQEAANVR